LAIPLARLAAQVMWPSLVVMSCDASFTLVGRVGWLGIFPAADQSNRCGGKWPVRGIASAEALAPDGPAVIAAIDLVRGELSILLARSASQRGVGPKRAFTSPRCAYWPRCVSRSASMAASRQAVTSTSETS
jgi:hypothetical protein